jgi:hypothetical protein
MWQQQYCCCCCYHMCCCSCCVSKKHSCAFETVPHLAESDYAVNCLTCVCCCSFTGPCVSSLKVHKFGGALAGTHPGSLRAQSRGHVICLCMVLRTPATASMLIHTTVHARKVILTRTTPLRLHACHKLHHMTLAFGKSAAVAVPPAECRPAPADLLLVLLCACRHLHGQP